ncbi:MAG TPA: shikimate dehydrogenase [Candidatus Acidoferrales bacterium]|nr:shikimate dehydrogenase [Candidatus Acidoferrales bacterium]
MKKNIKSLTKLVGIIGHPIAHSWSPVIHETAFKLAKLNYSYSAFDVHPKRLGDALKGMSALGIVGVNVTVPHKEAVMEHLDEISADARLVGAVNTIYVQNDSLVGHNTDVDGAVAALKPYRDQIADENVTIYGAGGGARAVVYSLIAHFKPAQISVINRDTSRAELLKKFFFDSQNYKNIRVVELHNINEGTVVESSKLIVNATQVGMSPAVSENIMVQDDRDYDGKIFFDLVYNPVHTSFLRAAKKKNAVTISGLEMLYNQAASAFELWTGVAMPLERVRAKLDERFLGEGSRKKQKVSAH